jgi:hypothetical protein
MFPGWGTTADQQHTEDQLLHRFAVAAIRARPFAYLRLTGADFLHDLEPGNHLRYQEQALYLPAKVNPDAGPLAATTWPGYRNQARWPAPVLHQLSRVLRTPRWLLAATTVLAIFELLVWITRAFRRMQSGFPRRYATLLFTGMPLATLVATSATTQYGLRFVVAVAPLLVVGGGLAIEDAIGEWQARRARGRLTDSAELRPHAPRASRRTRRASAAGA